MNRLGLLFAALLMVSACGPRYPEHSVIVNSTDALFEEMAAYKPERWVYRHW